MNKMIMALLSLIILSGCASTQTYTEPVRAPSTVTLMSAYTIKSNREHAVWIYCSYNNSDYLRQGELEQGRQMSSRISIPQPMAGEYPCLHMHSHPWEGYSHAVEPSPGPSDQDLQVSRELPSFTFAVVDKRGTWFYKNGKVFKGCPWNNDYSGVACNS